MPTARAPGRVTLIGDHTDYNGGLSLPMAIDLATEVTYTPKPDSFLVGIDSDQYPGEPIEIAVGGGRAVGGRPVPEHGRLAAALLGLQHTSAGGSVKVTSTLPVGAGLSSSAAFAVGLLLALGHDDDPMALAKTCQEAERQAGSHVGLLDPLAIAGAQEGHALHIDFHTLETHQVAIPQSAAFVIVHSEAPRLLVDSPYATRRAECERAAQVLGRPLGLCTLGDLSELTDPVLRRRARHVVTECTRVREAERRPRPREPRRPGGDHDRGTPEPGHRLPGLGARRRRARRRAARPAGRARGSDVGRRVRRVRHRALPRGLAGAGPGDPRAETGLADQPIGRGGATALTAAQSREDQACDCASAWEVVTSASRTPTARPLSIDSAARARPAARSSGAAGQHERGGGVQDADVAPGARLALEDGADDLGVEGGVATLEVGHRGRREAEVAGVDPPLIELEVARPPPAPAAGPVARTSSTEAGEVTLSSSRPSSAWMMKVRRLPVAPKTPAMIGGRSQGRRRRRAGSGCARGW